MPGADVTTPRQAVRVRVVRVATVALAVGLLAASILGTVRAGQEASLEDLDRALTSEAIADSSALREYFDRARSLSLLLAHDSAFKELSPELHGGDGAHAGEHAVRVSTAGDAMAYLEQLYPGGISEACLIDTTGTEIARVVRGEVAGAHELSHEEASAPFFAPTLRLPAGRVHQGVPYLSPDTDEWVISNSTPLVGASGTPWSLVHFEVSLDSFRFATGRGRADGPVSVSVVDVTSGRVLLRDGRAVLGDGRGVSGPAGLAALLAEAPAGGTTAATLGGRRLAVSRLSQQQDNDNSWAVVASAPVGDVPWWQAVGPVPLATALAAALMLGLVGMSTRSGHRRLRAASLTDALTGLPNRRLLTDRVEQALLLSRRRGTTCAVLLIDLDRFKEVNDTLGHQHGDLLLRAVAGRLAEVFRGSDTISRLGGDEFAILLPEVADEAAATALARRCISALAEPFLIDGVWLSVEASIGLALAPAHGQDVNALLRSADVAMYEAKSRACGVTTYDAELDINTPTRLALLGDLRRAMQNGELFLDYQPKVDLDTGDVRGVEALVRWHHPDRGLLPPSEFVPAAEGTGLIVPLTVRTLEIAISQAKAWLDAGHAVQVAVNLSPRCLIEADFPAVIQDLLTDRQLPAALLRLEITESSIMADPARALAALQSLKASGIALSIDDFGTGYSSMSYLKRLPVDELKIDRSFVLDMLAQNSDSVLVRSSIDLGHNLGLSVVAEGVEDQATVNALVGLGCDVVQGFHLARPMSAEAATAWLAGRVDPARSVPD